MEITPEQARVELAKRELARRGLSADTNKSPNTAYINAQGQSEIAAEPVPEADKLAQAKNEWFKDEIQAGRIKAVEPSFWEKLRAEFPETAGGITGGIAGAKIGADLTTKGIQDPRLKALGVLAGGIGGAMIGGMGGKSAQNLYQKVTGGPSKTAEELWNETLQAGYNQGTGEIVGRGIAGVGGKLLAPFAKKLKPEATRLWDIMRKYGVHPTPAQATESRIVDTMEGMAEKALFTTDDLQRLKTVAEPAAFERYIDDVAKQIGRGVRQNSETAGELLDASLTKRREIFDAAIRAKYKIIDKLGVPGFAKQISKNEVEVHIVDNQPLRDAAKHIYDKASLNKKLGESSGIMQLAEKAMNLPDADSFVQAISARSSLLKEVAEIEGSGVMRSPKPTVERAAKSLAMIADRQMEKAAQRVKLQFPAQAGQFELLWRSANKFKREGEEIFHKKIVQALAKNLSETPSAAVSKVFNDPTQAREIFKLVDDPTKTALRSAYLEQMLNDARSVDKVVAGKTLKRIITDDKTHAVMKEVFTKEHIQNINDIADWGTMTQSATGGGGGMLIQLTQGGAIMGLLSTPYKKTSSTLLLTPPIMSKIMASKAGAYWLSKGIKLPANSPDAAAIATKIANMVYQANKENIEQGD